MVDSPHGQPDFITERAFEHYGEIQSEEAIRYASEILAFVSAQVA